GSFKSPHEMQCQIGLRLDFARILRQDGSQALDVTGVCIFARQIQSCSNRLDVKFFERCRFTRHSAQLASLSGSLKRTFGSSFVRFSSLRGPVVFELKPRTKLAVSD